MLLRRLHRLFATWFVAACMLFAQTAAVAYACPRDAAEPVAPCAAHLSDEGGIAQPGALPDGNVCEVHCHPVSLPDAGGADVPVPLAVLAWRLPPLPAAVSGDSPFGELEAKSASPPARTLYARLLI